MIAMGYPADSVEGVYRNYIGDVSKYEKHTKKSILFTHICFILLDFYPRNMEINFMYIICKNLFFLIEN